MKNFKFNIFKNGFRNIGFESIESIFTKIHNGEYKQIIEKIRSTDPKLKRKLDGIVFSTLLGEKNRNTKNIEEYTSYVIIDFDHLINVLETKEIVIQSEYTIMCFVSPSGNGLKVLVKTNNYDLEYHKSSYIQVQKYYEKITALKTDNRNIDAVRLCYFSYDPEAYLNLQAKEFTVEKIEKEELYRKNFEDKITNTINFTNKRAQFKKGNRNKYIFFLATNCCKMGFEKNQVVQYCHSKFKEIDFDTDEITSTINSAYQINKNSFGVNDKYNRNNPSNSNNLNDLTKQIEELNNTVKTLSNFIIKSNKIEEI